MKNLLKIFSGFNKTRILIITVVIGSVILAFLKFLYPLTDLTQTVTFVVLISIIISIIIERLFNSKKNRKDDNTQF